MSVHVSHTRTSFARGVLFSMTVLSGSSEVACARDGRIAASKPTLRGAGASLPAPLVSRWAEAYRGPGRVDYRAVGSGGAVRMLDIGTIDFGVRDVPLSSLESARMREPVLEVPVAHGAVAVAANLPEVKSLRLGKTTLGALFMGKIDRWDDPAIVRENPNVTLPKLPVLLVHRSDASGTERLFAEYVAGATPELGAMDPTGPRFPKGVRAKGTEGVALALKSSRGSLGVLELGIARESGLVVAMLETEGGLFVAPTTVTPSTNASEVGASYPLVTTVFALLPKRQGPSPNGAVAFVRWSLGEGQNSLEGDAELATRAFGPLSNEERTRALALLDATFGGPR